MTNLREELARVLFERHYKHAGAQAYMIAKEREGWRLFLLDVDREFMPAINADKARVRAEERAKVQAEFIGPSYVCQDCGHGYEAAEDGNEDCPKCAPSIRALKD